MFDLLSNARRQRTAPVAQQPAMQEQAQMRQQTSVQNPRTYGTGAPMPQVDSLSQLLGLPAPVTVAPGGAGTPLQNGVPPGNLAGITADPNFSIYQPSPAGGGLTPQQDLAALQQLAALYPDNPIYAQLLKNATTPSSNPALVAQPIQSGVPVTVAPGGNMGLPSYVRPQARMNAMGRPAWNAAAYRMPVRNALQQLIGAWGNRYQR